MKPKFGVGDTVETPYCMGWVKQIFLCVDGTGKYVYSVKDAEDDQEYLVFEDEVTGV